MKQDLVGRGIVFPVKLTSRGFPVYEGGITLIESSIKMILSWPIRQRIYLSEFGSKLEACLGEPNDDLIKGLMEHYIVDSLNQWDIRIQVIDVLVDRTEPDKLDITLTYGESSTGLERTLTFPFYKNLPY